MINCVFSSRNFSRKKKSWVPYLIVEEEGREGERKRGREEERERGREGERERGREGERKRGREEERERGRGYKSMNVSMRAYK
jgi:hypothetical protein